MAEQKTVITLICERAADVNGILNKDGECTSVPGVKMIQLPCSGMVQPLMIEAAMKAGASGVIVCGCQIGDCYYREGNRMIRERLLGERPPGLKKTVDRRRVMALWLSRLQRGRFETEAKEFVAYVNGLDGDEKVAAKIEGAKAAPAAAKPEGEKIDTTPKPAEKVEAKAEAKPKEEKKAEEKPKAEEKKAEEQPKADTDSGAKKDEAKAEESADKKAADAAPETKEETKE